MNNFLTDFGFSAKQLCYLLILTCGLAINDVLADNDVLLTNLEPDEAKQILDQQDQSLRYAPQIDSNVPAVRFLGNEPHHVLEDIYLARQYHGQDGLGAYLYGYSVPDIAKNEKKERSGDLRGDYSYINTEGKEVKVHYWDDGTGFHQEDNLAQILPKQVEDSPDVKAAKEKFFRIWNQEAERNAQGAQPQPPVGVGQGPFGAPQYPAYIQQPTQFQKSYQPAPQFQQPGRTGKQLFNPPQGSLQSQNQGAAPYGINPNSGASNPNSIDYSGQYSEKQPAYAQPAGKQGESYEENPEENGPPKGFFYAFDYPVGIIVNRGEKIKRETLESIYSQGKDLFEKQLKGAAQAPASGSTSYIAARRK